MKQKILFIALGTLLSIFSYAQDTETVSFEDGTVLDVRTNSTSPLDVHKASISIGSFTPEGTYFLGASYHLPQKFYANLFVGTKGFQGDFSYFLTSKFAKKKKKVNPSLKSKSGGYNTTIQYKKENGWEIDKSICFGLHAGYATFGKMRDLFNGIYSVGPENLNTVFGGITLLKSFNLDIDIAEDGQAANHKGSMVRRLNADVVFYPNFKIENDQHELVEESIVGFRTYFEGNNSLWIGKGHLSMKYLIGVGIRNGTFYLPAGLGLSFDF